MTSKERVLRIINNKEADRVAIDYGAVDEVTSSLLKHFRLKNKEELLKLFNVDFRRSDVCFQDLNPVKWVDEEIYIDMWGVGKSCKLGGTSVHHPLKDAQSIDDVLDYPWPNPDDIDIERFCHESELWKDYCVYGGMWSPIFHIGCDLMGMENFMVTLYTNPDLAHFILDKATDFYLEVNRRMFEKAHNLMDIFFMAEDLGTQEGLLMSKQLFYQYLQPRFKKLYDMAKEYGFPVLHHSCGAIKEIIPDLIKIGMDGLDPIQVSAKNMNVKEIKAEYGKQIFLRGSIDTVVTLPFGTCEDVKNEVIDRLVNIAPGGGFIFNSSQELLPEISVENIICMYETVNNCGYYDSLGKPKYNNFKLV